MTDDFNPGKAFLLESLPPKFIFPSSYIDFILSKKSKEIYPWWLMYDRPGTSDAWIKTLREAYPDRSLVPFAKYSYTDDIACFEADSASSDPVVHYIHAFTTPGWEDRGHVKNFSEWLHLAILDAKDDKNSRIMDSEALR